MFDQAVAPEDGIPNGLRKHPRSWDRGVQGDLQPLLIASNSNRIPDSQETREVVLKTSLLVLTYDFIGYIGISAT